MTTRPFHPSVRRAEQLAAGLLLLGTLPLARFLRPWLAHAPTICFFRAMTGRPCVFCGLTRAVACAMRGEFAAAYAYHALWLPAVGVIAALGGSCLIAGLTGRDATAFWRRLWEKGGWFIAAGVVIGTIVRAIGRF